MEARVRTPAAAVRATTRLVLSTACVAACAHAFAGRSSSCLLDGSCAAGTMHPALQLLAPGLKSAPGNAPYLSKNYTICDSLDYAHVFAFAWPCSAGQYFFTARPQQNPRPALCDVHS